MLLDHFELVIRSHGPSPTRTTRGAWQVQPTRRIYSCVLAPSDARAVERQNLRACGGSIAIGRLFVVSGT